MNNENQFAALAERHSHAIEVYRKIYAAEHPAPQRKIYAANNTWERIALTLLVAAAVVVSASHTVPVFVKGTGDVVGIAAFIMMELGLVFLKYKATHESFEKHPDKPHDVSEVTHNTVKLTFVILLVANVYYTLGSVGLSHSVIDLLAAFAIGISAPTLAYVCGGVLAVETVKTQLRQRALDREYTQEMADYNDSFLKWWQARRTKVVNMTVEKDAPSLSNGISNGIPLENAPPPSLPSASTLNHRKAPDAMKRVREYFAETPTAHSEDPLKIAAQLGVGKSTVYNYLKADKARASNGNGAHGSEAKE